MAANPWSELLEGLDESPGEDEPQQEPGFDPAVYGSPEPPTYETLPVAVPRSYATPRRARSEVERRLARAALYRKILSEPIFDGSLDEDAEQVQAEFQAFAESKLEELVGMTPATTPAGGDFDHDEVLILKALCAKVRGSVKMRKAATAEAPPARPTVRPRQLQAGEGREPESPQPYRRQQPQVQPQSTPQRLRQPSAPRLPEDGEVYEDGPKRFKVKWVVTDPSEFPKQTKTLEKIRPQGYAQVPGGVLVRRDENGVYFKLVKMDLTAQAVPHPSAGRLPPLHPDQMSAMTAARSAQVIQQMPAGAIGIVNRLTQ